MTDWDAFRGELNERLGGIPVLVEIIGEEQFREAVMNLERCIEEVVAAVVPMATITPFTKRWWDHELTKARCKGDGNPVEERSPLSA
jgi:hypothetical protein